MANEDEQHDVEVEVVTGKWLIVPPEPNLCQVCGVDHTADMPHNAQSLYYGMRFHQAHGRAATWADAVAHTDEAMRDYWRRQLTLAKAWTEPPDGVAPIAEPYRRDAAHPTDT